MFVFFYCFLNNCNLALLIIKGLLCLFILNLFIKPTYLLINYNMFFISSVSIFIFVKKKNNYNFLELSQGSHKLLVLNLSQPTSNLLLDNLKYFIVYKIFILSKFSNALMKVINFQMTASWTHTYI